MRILQVSSARAFGGGERHLADLARGLARRGHELFAALAHDSPLRDELDALPPRNVHTLALRNALDIGSALKLARSLRAQNIFDPEKIRIVTNGVDLRRFADARAEFERSVEKSEKSVEESGRDSPEGDRARRPLRVGIVGELSEVKGLEDFVRAAAVVAERFGDAVEFVIVGDDATRTGEYRARVERLVAELGLKERVRLLG